MTLLMNPECPRVSNYAQAVISLRASYAIDIYCSRDSVALCAQALVLLSDSIANDMNATLPEYHILIDGLSISQLGEAGSVASALGHCSGQCQRASLHTAIDQWFINQNNSQTNQQSKQSAASSIYKSIIYCINKQADTHNKLTTDILSMWSPCCK
jgi:hypothetical protein